MGSIANLYEVILLEHVFKISADTPDSNLYVGLSTADPLDDMSGLAEPSGNNYARVSTAGAGWNTAASRAITNNGVINFNQASGSWGTITHYFICDHASNTNWGTDVDAIATGALAASKSVVNGNTPSIADQEISISFNASNGFSNYLANELLDHVFMKGAYTVPTNIYVGLSCTTPNDDGTGITEPPEQGSVGSSASAYDRVNLNTWNAAAQTSEGPAMVSNNGAITFPTPGASWGTITYCVIYDADWPADANVLCYGTVENQIPGDGDTVQFATGVLQIELQ
jgi:hypothetical protein